jgi:hypothetical protein
MCHTIWEVDNVEDRMCKIIDYIRRRTESSLWILSSFLKFS